MAGEPVSVVLAFAFFAFARPGISLRGSWSLNLRRRLGGGLRGLGGRGGCGFCRRCSFRRGRFGLRLRRCQVGADCFYGLHDGLVAFEGYASIGRRGVKLRDELVQGFQGCSPIAAGGGFGNSEDLGL